jgi:hypothetical protein
LQALNGLIGALSPGAGPRPSANPPDAAAGSVSGPASIPGIGAEVPPGLNLGSASAGSGSGASGASAGATGLNLGASSAGAGGSPPPPGASGLMFGSDAAPTSSSSSNPAKNDSPFEAPRFSSRIKDEPTKTIEVPFSIVVVCEPDGVVIHPGGYRITARSLETGRADSLLVKELLAVARQRAATDPSIRPIPRVKFLVEGGGTETFWAARKQILFSGLSWPMSLQVTGAQDPHPLGKETW